MHDMNGGLELQHETKVVDFDGHFSPLDVILDSSNTELLVY